MLLLCLPVLLPLPYPLLVRLPVPLPLPSPLPVLRAPADAIDFGGASPFSLYSHTLLTTSSPSIIASRGINSKVTEQGWAVSYWLLQQHAMGELAAGARSCHLLRCRSTSLRPHAAMILHSSSLPPLMPFCPSVCLSVPLSICS